MGCSKRSGDAGEPKLVPELVFSALALEIPLPRRARDKVEHRQVLVVCSPSVFW